jgi:hypothetical protein
MIFSSMALTRWRSSAGRWAAKAVLLSLGLLAACGGGSSQFDPFVPGRLLVFGDEDSSLDPNGRSYSVNALGENGLLNCQGNPIWVQQLAGVYGFVFAECNPTFEPNPRARMLAVPGAKVADVAAQVEAQVAAGGFRDKDLATVLAGTNDLLELYAQYPGLNEATLLAEARARGQRLAQVVNRLVALGAKVVVSDVPDLGVTPFARAETRLDPTGVNRAALLSRLTTAFNEQLGVSVLLDGRFVGLMQSQLRFQAIDRFPPAFNLGNVSDPVCTVPLPTCTSNTLVVDGVPGAYLWSSDVRLAPGGHAQLAGLAVDRAQRNPF